jgi:hypothetical protein
MQCTFGIETMPQAAAAAIVDQDVDMSVGGAWQALLAGWGVPADRGFRRAGECGSVVPRVGPPEQSRAERPFRGADGNVWRFRWIESRGTGNGGRVILRPVCPAARAAVAALVGDRWPRLAAAGVLPALLSLEPAQLDWAEDAIDTLVAIRRLPGATATSHRALARELSRAGLPAWQGTMPRWWRLARVLASCL